MHICVVHFYQYKIFKLKFMYLLLFSQFTRTGVGLVPTSHYEHQGESLTVHFNYDVLCRNVISYALCKSITCQIKSCTLYKNTRKDGCDI